ncbi:MFS transporter [Pseudarthrobacter sp. lyk4-40-TYG-27]|uniref:MFS transporter n=1 Tax=Pseudarthrobacter sp. lyk4-40-TYG-27 TaxID=3040305 RepID=UPI0025547862|nr:MFS transporter [Pseudarthrobacter sp. lyk4-40-TYG-27]
MVTENTTATSTGRRLSGGRIFAVSFLGTTLEYYDFLVYGLATGLVFNKLFFPESDPLIGILLAFAAFGTGYLTRPIGGVVFGHFGDRYGRQRVLILTLIIMGATTFLIGCLPTYQEVGFLAPALLIVLRLVQGFAAGGELGGAALFGIENAPEGRRGMWGSFSTMGIAAGFVVGSAVFAVVSAVFNSDLLSFAWRIPFWIGGVLATVGAVARFALPREDSGSSGGPKALPILKAFRAGPKIILAGIGVSLAYNAVSAVYSTFMLSYLNTAGYSSTDALTGMLYTAVLQIPLILGAAHLSDRIGRRRVLVTGAVLAAIIAFIAFPMLNSLSLTALFSVFTLVSVSIGMALGPIPAFLAEQFPSEARYSGLSMVFQVGASIGGGTGSLTAVALLVANKGNPLFVSVYVVTMAALMIVGVMLLRETARVPLKDLGR